MQFWSFLDYLIQDTYIIFQNSVDNFEFGLRNRPCSSPLIHLRLKVSSYYGLLFWWELNVVIKVFK